MSNRAVFFDRDGTLIEHYDYLTDPDQVKVKDGTCEALRLLRDRGYFLVVVTNQSAVARGMLAEEKLLDIHKRLKEQLAAGGVHLDQIYYCPYHPDGAIEKYRRDSDLRKPSPGMLLLAAQELDIDLKDSWMIGDDDRDVLAGQAAGCRAILLENYHSSPLVQTDSSNPDYRAVNLREAANLIVRYIDVPNEESDKELGDIDEQSNGVARGNSSGKASGDANGIKTANGSSEAATGVSNEVVAKGSSPVQVVDASVRAAQSWGDITAELSASGAIGLVAGGVTAEVEQGDTNTDNQPGTQEQVGDGQVDEQEDNGGKVSSAVSVEELRTGLGRIRGYRSQAKRAQLSESATNEELLTGILRELRLQNRQDRFSEFSIPKLIAGIVQMLVFLCLVLVFWFRSGPEPNVEATHTCLSMAMILQMLTLTLLIMHRQQ